MCSAPPPSPGWTRVLSGGVEGGRIRPMQQRGFRLTARSEQRSRCTVLQITAETHAAICTPSPARFPCRARPLRVLAAPRSPQPPSHPPTTTWATPGRDRDLASSRLGRQKWCFPPAPLKKNYSGKPPWLQGCFPRRQPWPGTDTEPGTGQCPGGAGGSTAHQSR